MKWNKLDKEVVLRLVSEKEIGAYCLGTFITGSHEVKYVGRSDNNLRNRLLNHAREGKYVYFAFWTTKTIIEAYYKECELFHNHNSAVNKMHPDAPRNLPYFCPFCLTHKNFEQLMEVV